MQILIPDSWLRDYLETDADPKEIQRCLSLCGPSIERLHQQGSDSIYDIEVTTNRVDCMSVIGIAREAAAILPRFNHSAKLLADPFLHDELKTSPQVNYLHVSLNPQLCPHFAAVLIKNVTVKSSPNWLVKKLELAGMRSLNIVVDISNLLMLEMGQPVHTFDYDKISQGTLILRESLPGEKITTLDNQTHVLPGHDIIIEDGSGRLIDLCGIMGGANSAIDSDTRNVLLFVQTYEPVHVRKTSMFLGTRSAAAVLFEKGLSPESVLPTLSKGVELFKLLANGEPDPTALEIQNYTSSAPSLKLTLPLSQLASNLLGVSLSFPEISSILTDLGFTVKSDTEIIVPWFRQLDISIPEDLVEEIARIYGYHHLPSQLMAGALPDHPQNSEFVWTAVIKSALSHWGFTETYTYSLVQHDTGLKLKNPLSSDWTYLRTSLTPSHLQVIAENIGRVPEINLFEIANVYLPQKSGLPIEQLHLILTTTLKEYLKFKGYLDSLLYNQLGLSVSSVDYQIVDHPDCLTCEIDLSAILPQASAIKKFTPISKFTPIIEDINLTLKQSYSDLIKQIESISPLIKQIDLIDKYGSKLTLRLTFHSPERQLTSGDVAPLRQQLLVQG